MTISSAEITAWVGAFLWPLFRIAAMMTIAPIYGSKTVPMRFRLGLAVIVAITFAPLVPEVPRVDVFSPETLLIIIHQILIGLAMGFALQMVISAVVTGAQIVSLQMGLGFAMMVDPQNGQQAPVLSQFYILLTLLVFLALDGHLLFFEVLADSFKVLPITPQGLSTDSIWLLLTWASQIFSGAVGLALPAIASLLVVNIAFGIMTRAAPQLNIFAIGFPITMMIGFGVIMVTLSNVIPRSTGLFTDAYRLIRQMLVGG